MAGQDHGRFKLPHTHCLLNRLSPSSHSADDDEMARLPQFARVCKCLNQASNVFTRLRSAPRQNESASPDRITRECGLYDIAVLHRMKLRTDRRGDNGDPLTRDPIEFHDVGRRMVRNGHHPRGPAHGPSRPEKRPSLAKEFARPLGQAIHGEVIDRHQSAIASPSGELEAQAVKQVNAIARGVPSHQAFMALNESHVRILEGCGIF